MKQMSFFDGSQPFVVDKPIRLIEMFAGYGSQALALKYLGIPFESWRISEWAIASIKAYKDLHHKDDSNDYSKGMSTVQIQDWLCGRISTNYNEPMTRRQIFRMSDKKVRAIYNNMMACRNPGSITKIHAADLCIEDTDRYTYITFYSFPCQDLSVAGKGAGCAKGSGTRSGMLWEVERILDELYSSDKGGRYLPQVLIAENVPALLSEKNSPDFNAWLRKLESLGYHNYHQVLNAKDYGVPQSRNRVFIVSILGDYYFDFPAPIPLEFRLKDVLERNVHERYYLKEARVRWETEHSAEKKAKGCGFDFAPTDGGGCASCVTTRAGQRTDDNYIEVRNDD